MKIYGIGADIVKVKRLKKSVKKKTFIQNYSISMKLINVKN